MSIKGVGPGNTPYDLLEIQKRKLAKAVKNSAQSANDTASLSADAKLRAAALAEAKAAPDMRGDKVALLKAKVQDGTYEPDSKAIAGKMVAEELEEWE
ncbi:MAG: flagellar biosynthesis anti-sigma factor FlgM [Thermodesulfobacteriota bacterium]|nr:flagellar biosynthesis anti-sigma factor FlgM [Thermodesulfobacteriota bacterium]